MVGVTQNAINLEIPDKDKDEFGQFLTYLNYFSEKELQEKGMEL